MIKEIRPTDIIALVILVGCFILVGMGKDSGLFELLRAVAFFYFGAKVGVYFVEKKIRYEQES